MISSLIDKVLVPTGDAIRGIPTRARYRELLESQWWDPQPLYELQARKLRRLIQHAYRHTRFYRALLDRHGVTPGMIQEPADLGRIPPLTKQDVKDCLEDLVAGGAPPRDLRPQHTGGTTGIPLQFYFDRNTWAMGRAVLYRAFSWGGYRLGDPLINLVGGSLGGERDPLARKLGRFVLRKKSLPAFELVKDNLHEYLRAIRARRAKFLRGYASAVAHLAELVREEGRQEVRFQAVFPTAEILTDHQRDLLAEVFHCQVLDFYGCGEVHGLASECEQGTLHVADEHVILELAEEGRPVSAGQSGEVLLTDLDNLSMPFIRYRVGDAAEAATQPCPCGRALSPLAKLHGRFNDMLRTTRGERISGNFLPHLVGPMVGVQEYQVVQDRLDHLDLKIVRGKEFEPRHVATILGEVRSHLGAEMEVDVTYVEAIQRARSQKRRFCICLIDADKGTIPSS
ncbi:MAG: phenylacetate--CoA ligase family protein [Acidobacteriota bacterium]